MDRIAPRGWPRRAVVLALLASLAFGALVRVAIAETDNYHSIAGVWHGFVHGESKTDGSFHSRARTGDTTQYPRGCEIDSASGYVAAHEEYGDVFTTCDIWSLRVFSSTPTECYWRAETMSGRAFPWHHNRPTNYCG